MDNLHKNIIIFCSTIIIFSYFFGYYLDENSIGSGGYRGDLAWIWQNYEIFRKQNFIDAIRDESFFGNRTHLLYIINYYLNPFINNIDNYRLSITFFSIVASYVFYLCLLNRFKQTNYIYLILVSLLVLLSPFYRTSAYWGMEIQYGIISALLAIYFFTKEDNIKKISSGNLFLSIFFSSCTVYFDLKLILIPLYIYIKIIFSNLTFREKAKTSIIYFILAIPFILLIFQWGGLVPIETQNANPLQGTHLISKLHFVNILFATNIIGLYMFPLLIFKRNILESLKKIINPTNIILFALFLIYLVSFLYFDLYDYTDKLSREYGGYKNFWGLGYSQKLSNLIFENRFYSLFFNLIIYFVSITIILLVVDSRLINLTIVLFFYLLSIFLFPLMQEYFDPYILLFGVLLFKNDYKFNFEKCAFAFLFFGFFLLSSIYYYQ